MNTMKITKHRLQTFLDLFHDKHQSLLYQLYQTYLCTHNGAKVDVAAPTKDYTFEGPYCLSCLVTLLTKSNIVFDVRKTCRLCYKSEYAVSIVINRRHLNFGYTANYIVHKKCLLEFIDRIGIDSLDTMIALKE